eukprot:PhM_4_TR2052/c4_g3_i3/m.9960
MTRKLRNCLKARIIKFDAVGKAVEQATNEVKEGDSIDAMCNRVCAALCNGRDDVLPTSIDASTCGLAVDQPCDRSIVKRIVLARLAKKLYDDVVSRVPDSIRPEDFDPASVMASVDHALEQVSGVKHDSSSAAMCWDAARHISSLA